MKYVPYIEVLKIKIYNFAIHVVQVTVILSNGRLNSNSVDYMNLSTHYDKVCFTQSNVRRSRTLPKQSHFHAYFYLLKEKLQDEVR